MNKAIRHYFLLQVADNGLVPGGGISKRLLGRFHVLNEAERQRKFHIVDVMGIVESTLVGEAFSNAPYVALVADDDMRLVAATDAACELLGWGRDQLLQRSVQDIVVDRTEAIASFGNFVREGSQRGVITLRRRDGSTVEAEYEAHRSKIAGAGAYISVLMPRT